MDTSEQLDLDIEKMRELGISYGLDDRQIDQCLLNAMWTTEPEAETTETATETPATETASDTMVIERCRGACGGTERTEASAEITESTETTTTRTTTTAAESERYNRGGRGSDITTVTTTENVGGACGAPRESSETEREPTSREAAETEREALETKLTALKTQAERTEIQPETTETQSEIQRETTETQSERASESSHTKRHPNNTTSHPSSPPSPPRQKRRPCCSLLRVIFALTLSLVSAYALSYHEPSMAFIDKHFQRHSYPVLRLIRSLTYPWGETLGLEGWYDEECLVPNPYYLPPPAPIDCQQCRDLHAVHQYTREKGFSSQLFQSHYYNRPQPLVIKDAYELIATFADLVKLYRDNRQPIEAGRNKFYSTDENVDTVEQLFTNVSEKYIKMNTFFHAEWMTRKMGASQVLRRLFPRLYFLPPHSEVAMDKVILVDAPGALPYMVPRPVFPNGYYLQAFGTRQLELVPGDQCTLQCTRISLQMMPGYVLYFMDPLWSLDSVPVFGESSMEQISVAYVGSFS